MLDSELRKLGMFMCLNTNETPGIGNETRKVGRGEPNRFGLNNGVYAVFDEHGNPWIAGASSFRGFGDQLNQLAKRFGLESGCYVPHSNDGGYFIRHVMPSLARR